MNKKSIFKTEILAMLLVLFALQSHAQIEVVACYSSDGKMKSPGSTWIEQKDGITYDCICDGSGGTCTPRQSSSTSSNRGSGSATTSDPDPGRQQALELERQQALEFERQQTLEREKAILEKQQAFDRGQTELSSGLKGKTSTGTPILKTGTTSLPLKQSANSQSIGLKTGDATVKAEAIKEEDEKIKSVANNENRKLLIEQAMQAEREAILLNMDADR